MKQQLKEALQASATFNITGDDNYSKMLCLLPGIYDTDKFVFTPGKSGEDPTCVMNKSNTANLVNAGYPCDQVADDYDANDSDQLVEVTSVTRTKYRDFRNTVERIGIRVKKIVIQNKTNPSDETLFDQEIELSRTAIGAKGATRFLKLQNYISTAAYDRSKIEIEFTDDAPLDITPDTYMAMRIPAGANFSMQFVFEA